jgi:hypothetical protein
VNTSVTDWVLSHNNSTVSFTSYYPTLFIITIEMREAHRDVIPWSIIGYEKCSQSVAHIKKYDCYRWKQLS